MHSFFSTLLDIVFPPSPHARIVRETTFDAFAASYAPHHFKGASALASYHNPTVRACIHEAKFHRNKHAIELLGRLLARHLREKKSVHLIPIPLSPARLRERGYNQTLEIAVAARTYAPPTEIHDALLKKVRHTASQTSLARAERLKNLADAFGVGDHTLPLNTPLILFDDVTTTGSTFAEATRTLRAAGFTRIQCLAIAH